VQSASADGKERLLLCLNVTDGKILWSRSAPGSFVRINPKNTLASSTPATDGRLVYAVFWDGASLSLSAYDFKGTLVWTRDLGGLTTQHGAGISPVVHKDRLFLANDQDVSSNLLAFDSRTGKPLWQASRQNFNACYSTPFLLERPGDGVELLVASTQGLSGYDPETGRENWNWIWSFPNKPLRTVSSPIYSDGIVFATSGDGGGDRHMVAVKLGSKTSGTKAELAWESKRTLPYVPSLLAWGNHIYWVNDLGIAGCNVAKTGESVWTERLGGNIFASPVLIDGKIYAINEDGEVFVFPASPTFKLLAKNSLGELVRATPAVAANRLFIRGSKHLFCIGQPGGFASQR
jgi:outer membrane protein assembly factor BamB